MVLRALARGRKRVRCPLIRDLKQADSDLHGGDQL